MTLRPTTRIAGDVTTYVKRQFGDEAGVQLTDSDIFRWINLAQVEIASRNKITKRKAATNVVSGQDVYLLEGLNILQIESIHYNGGLIASQEMAQAEQTISRYTGNTGAKDIYKQPVLWYEWDGQITLWPTPTENIENGLVLYYTGMPVQVSSLGDALTVPDIYYSAVTSFVMAQAYEQDESFAESDLMMQRFERALDSRSEEERAPGQITYPHITFVE